MLGALDNTLFPQTVLELHCKDNQKILILHPFLNFLEKQLLRFTQTHIILVFYDNISPCQKKAMKNKVTM
jgi:tRNA(Ile)-lysidine synthase TilS/MesJ